MSEFKIVEKVVLKQYYVLDPGCMNLIVLQFHNDPQLKQWRIDAHMEGQSGHYIFHHEYQKSLDPRVTVHLNLIDETEREPGDDLVIDYAKKVFKEHCEFIERLNR